MAKKPKSTRKKAKKKAGAKKKQGIQAVTVRVEVTPTDDAPTLYANYAEISRSIHDFALRFALVPSKPRPSQVREAEDTVVLDVEPEVQVILPPTVIPGLISALEQQLEKYEQAHGKIARESG